VRNLTRVALVVIGLVALPAGAFLVAKSVPEHGSPPPAQLSPAPAPAQQSEPSIPI
jgi:hypothetical protein